MSDRISINGRVVSVSTDLKKTAADSNYILIRTEGRPLNKKQKTELDKLGVKIQEFVGNETDQIYLCGYEPEDLELIRSLDFINYANVYSETFVIPKEIKDTTAHAPGDHSADSRTIEVDVLLHHDVGDVPSELVAKIAKEAGVEVNDVYVGVGFVRIKLPEVNLAKVAIIDEVRVIHPVVEAKLFNNVARQIMGVPNAKFGQTALTGEGQIVCVADTGFDKGSTTDTLDAFTGRVKQVIGLGRPDQADDPDGHGTHVCGSVLGSGQHKVQGLIQGSAPGATLMMQSTFSGFGEKGGSMLGGIPADLADLFQPAYDAGARVHTNSWGRPLPLNFKQNPYDGNAEAIDRFIFDHQDMTILFAAGNDGQDQDRDGTINLNSLGAQASAKNCITVGASENNRPELASGVSRIQYTYGGFWPNKYTKPPLRDDHQANNPEGLAAFSSRGPTLEGRLKPDVVAPGTAILSTRSRNKKVTSGIDVTGVSGDDRYMYLAGTSMATPLVAGCCAVVRESLLKNGYKDKNADGSLNPTGSLVKALIINGAVPIKGQYMPDEVGDEPNPHSGFGRVNVANSVGEAKGAYSGYGVGVIDEDTEEPVTVTIPVPKALQVQANGNYPGGGSSDLTLRVTMTYADLPGGALSNDLNLLVVAGNKERHGNQVNQDFTVGADQGFDRSNNVEQVTWQGIPGNEVQITVKHWRLLSEKVPFAYAYRFY